MNQAGEQIDFRSAVEGARLAKKSIAPDDPLPAPDEVFFGQTELQVTNETTLMASRRFISSGLAPLVLNFANGVQPGGGFLYGARAQEEVLCRSSALFETLVDDPMYEHHWDRELPDSTDWAILSPGVPVFRNDDGAELDRFWLLDFLTCAAPYAPDIGQPKSGDLLQQRIMRVLSIAKAFVLQRVGAAVAVGVEAGVLAGLGDLLVGGADLHRADVGDTVGKQRFALRIDEPAAAVDFLEVDEAGGFPGGGGGGDEREDDGGENEVDEGFHHRFQAVDLLIGLSIADRERTFQRDCLVLLWRSGGANALLTIGLMTYKSL